MTVKRIMVAYDGSPPSKKALDWSLGIAKDLGADIRLLMVFERNMYHMDLPTHLDDLEKTYMELFQSKLDAAIEACKDSAVQISGEVCNGHVSNVILQKADEWNADMVVCGTRGYGGFTNMLVGSTAHALVTYAKLPVIVIK